VSGTTKEANVHRSRALPVVGVLLPLVIGLAACGGGGATSAPAASQGGGTGGGDTGETVSMANTQFSPSELTIAPGTTVTFTNTSGHTVTEGSNGEAVADPIVDEQGGADVTVTFEEPGTYQITCKIHPSMNMTITVEG
jgi:plastocyanin